MSQIDADGRFASLPGGRMHYLEAGDGPAVVLLHGWPGHSFDYRRVLPRASRAARCIAPDFPGFGESDIPRGDPMQAASEDSFAGDIVDLLDVVGVDEAIIVGHDIGSAVGPAVARRAPERVRGLVLLNPTHPYIGSRRDAPAFQREAWYQHFHLLPLSRQLIDGDRARVAMYLAYFYEHWAGRDRISADDFEAVVEAYARPGRFAASIRWYEARAASRTPREPAAPLEIPTIALWGDRDPMRPLDHREGFERAFPRSESRTLAGVGHFVAAEAPDAVVQAINDLL
jgi:pimeloyl-ACP methyl ester carboxylesterase